MKIKSCPSCGSAEMVIFYAIKNVPAHSVLLLPTKENAIEYPRGDITLGFCETCGFISNVSFDSSLHEYSTGYESTQGYSPTFNLFAKKLAQNLINRYNLYNKDIIEIGCGKGEFLKMLCKLGGNKGIGFDPAYALDINENLNSDQTTFIKDFYSEKYTHFNCDFLCCRMTLEHIHETGDFIQVVRRSVQNSSETIVFFQVPNVIRILNDLAFWDIYYEHCSYFSPESLASLFRKNGFKIIDIWTDYDEQYVMLGAKLGSVKQKLKPLSQEDYLIELKNYIDFFSKDYRNQLDIWKRYLQNASESGRKVVLWGGGSKGVAFLTTLNIQNEIKYVVDINPNKHGTYMAGGGQKIVAPEFLEHFKPDVVIVMNPIYFKEIQEDLDRMGINAELISV